jgi:hypothetical protein
LAVQYNQVNVNEKRAVAVSHPIRNLVVYLKKLGPQKSAEVLITTSEYFFVCTLAAVFVVILKARGALMIEIIAMPEWSLLSAFLSMLSVVNVVVATLGCRQNAMITPAIRKSIVSALGLLALHLSMPKSGQVLQRTWTSAIKLGFNLIQLNRYYRNQIYTKREEASLRK